MRVKEISGGCPYGSHRVVEPKGSLPQPALKLDNDMSRVWAGETMIKVSTLNVDSASFAQIHKQAGGDVEKIKQTILEIVGQRGKLQNPVTGSGGMLMGEVVQIGSAAPDRGVKDGDKVASLVSLSLTPLKIDAILNVDTNSDQVQVEGHAIIFQSGVIAGLPEDIPERAALSVLDVCGAPIQTSRLARKGMTVLILGASGKSGVLCSRVAKNVMEKDGFVIGFSRSGKKLERLKNAGLIDEYSIVDAADPLFCHSEVERLTDGKMADLVINCVNSPDTEMASVLSCREGGTIYFFGMATSFTRAALGAEGVGKDVNMIIGNGYARGHAEYALELVRRSPEVLDLIESFTGGKGG